MSVVPSGMLGKCTELIPTGGRSKTYEYRCAQIFLYSTGGNSKPGNTVSIPGYVTAQHPGVHYDWWIKKGADYKMPGPEPHIKTNSGGGNIIKVPFTPHTYGECVVKNANWCAVSPPSHSNEASCWKVSTCFTVANRPHC